MIAKAKVISHGSTAVNYSTKKELVDVIQFHHLPEGISASAVWSRMMTLQEKYRGKLDQHRSLELTSIRIEVSPAREESVGWTLDDWRKLADDFVRTFDAIDLSEKAKRRSAKATNLRNSQYVASLHRDSKSGILHLHINANRIDMDGNVNDAHFLFERARMAANAVTKERGWVQAETKRLQNIKKYGDDCIDALKRMKRFSWEEYERLLGEKGHTLVFKRDSDGKVRGIPSAGARSCTNPPISGKTEASPLPGLSIPGSNCIKARYDRSQRQNRRRMHQPMWLGHRSADRHPGRSSRNPWPSNRSQRRSTWKSPWIPVGTPSISRRKSITSSWLKRRLRIRRTACGQNWRMSSTPPSFFLPEWSTRPRPSPRTAAVAAARPQTTGERNPMMTRNGPVNVCGVPITFI